jgi:hypothetical protein
MSDRRTYDTSRADEGRTGPPPFLLGAGVLLAVGAAAAWWMLRASEPPKPPPRPASTAVAGRNYVAAEHVDPESPRLSKDAAGNAVLHLVLRDVRDGERVHARIRDGGAADPGGPMVFLATKEPDSTIGALEVTPQPGPKAGEVSLTIPLAKPYGRATVIDLRWNDGKWEGFEVSATPASGPK